ncbi:MAG: hypothetical protein HYX27_10785 [Acidobacteria bacterium]|nr:hypothetical protein [Acidobacteriota bacterium]
MKHNWIPMLLIAGGLGAAMFGQQYPPYRDPNYDNRQYDNGQYSGDDDDYDDNDQGVYAPAPPPVPGYAYQRPLMPGPDYCWVDGYWNFFGGRYSWVGGYWMRPPYNGGYWVAPRYSGGRFFVGFWGGGPRGYNRVYVRNNYGYRGPVQVYRPGYRAPGYARPTFDRGFVRNDYRRGSGNREHHGDRR